MFSLDLRTSDLEYEITDLRGVNLFAPPPFTFLSYLGPETVLLGSLWFGRLSSLLGPKLRSDWEAKFGFGYPQASQRVRAGSVYVSSCVSGCPSCGLKACIYIQGVPGGMDKTSGECSLC